VRTKTVAKPEFDRDDLIRQAMEARAQAYAPYSKYAVGSALLTGSGRVFTGVNVENASYSLTICAERAAVASAVSAGETEFIAIAVATEVGVSPCGACRQVLREFGADIKVLVADSTGAFRETSVAELLPDGFTASDLETVRQDSDERDIDEE
jgi:cytidine deaminase